MVQTEFQYDRVPLQAQRSNRGHRRIDEAIDRQRQVARDREDCAQSMRSRPRGSRNPYPLAGLGGFRCQAPH